MGLLKGYKSYIVAVLVGLATIALQLQWIDFEVYTWIMSILVPGGIVALRAGMKNG